MQHLRTLDEGPLDASFDIMLDEALGSFDHELGSHLHKAVVHIARSLLGTDAAVCTQDDSAGIDILIDHEGGNAGMALAVDYRPVDRGSSTILRQKGGVQIEGAEFRHAPDLLGEHAEGNYHKEIGLPGCESLEEFGILELERLQHRQTVLHCIFLDGGLMHLEPAARRLVRHGNHADNLVAVLDKSIQRSHGKLGRSHKDDALLVHQAGHLALELAPAGSQRVVTLQKGRVVDGLPAEESPYRPEHEGRYKSADACGNRTVTRQFGAGNIHHPVQHEEQHRDDGAGAEPSLADEGAQRRADKEEQQTGQSLGELLQELDIHPAQVVVVFVDLGIASADVGTELTALVQGLLAGAYLVLDVLPLHKAGRREHLLANHSRMAGSGIQLVLHCQRIVLCDHAVIARMGLVVELAQRIAFVRQLVRVHTLDLVAETAGIRLLESVIAERNNQFLPREIHVLELQRGVAVLFGVGLLIVGAVVKGEGEIILVLAHLHERRIRQGDGDITLAGSVVINHHVVHNAGLVVLLADPENIAVDAVVEGSGGDFNLVLGAADIVAERINLVERLRHEVVAYEEGADADENGYHSKRHHHARKRNARALDGHELVVLAHLAQGHHGSQQSCQRQGQRHNGAAAPHHEFEHYLEPEALTHKFIDVQPQKLHHQNENDYQQDREERSYEAFHYELVELFQIFESNDSRAWANPATSLPPAVARPG